MRYSLEQILFLFIYNGYYNILPFLHLASIRNLAIHLLKILAMWGFPSQHFSFTNLLTNDPPHGRLVGFCVPGIKFHCSADDKLFFYPIRNKYSPGIFLFNPIECIPRIGPVKHSNVIYFQIPFNSTSQPI